MKAKDILAVKGRRVITIHQDNTVIEAIALFFANRVGSLIVVDENDDIKGILAPNDVLKAVHNDLDNIQHTKVSRFMSTNLIVAKLDDDIDYIQAVMTENRVRHIPIIEKGKLQGLVSIGDVVKAQLKIRDVENQYLKEYIEGKYPA
ncbi:MAG: CBS domain-containing protein [Desulfobulbaceae bacterium]|nr:MAG: CBS domain-containing protein [Desulfobulbaceae bacterium]